MAKTSKQTEQKNVTMTKTQLDPLTVIANKAAAFDLISSILYKDTKNGEDRSLTLERVSTIVTITENKLK